MIVIGALAAVFVLVMVIGVFKDTGKPSDTDRKNAEGYAGRSWAKSLKKPMAFFSPALPASALHRSGNSLTFCRFTIDKADKPPFRSLKLSVEPLPGMSPLMATCTFTYTTSGSSIDELNEQKDTLTHTNYTTTLAVTTHGGRLDLQPSNGTQVFMESRGENLLLCKRSASGVLTVNPDFKP